MKILTIILVVVALGIAAWFIATISKALDIPAGVTLPVSIAFGTFATLYVINYIKGLY
jgi:hypothetical protein